MEMISNEVTSASGGFILVVDDDYDLNMTLCDILMSHDYDVKSAFNGQEALEMLSVSRPALILSDISMPIMDGYTLLEHTRANPDWRGLPFIFLTSHADIADQRRALTIGIEDYLTKPVDTDDLILAVQNVYRRNQVTEEEIQLRMDSLRHEIVGVLQHEFRTPLTYVLTYAQYIQTIVSGEFEGSLEELQVATNGVLEGGNRLENLIESFLLLSELQNRSISDSEKIALPARTIAHEAITAVTREVNESNLQIQFEHAEPAGDVMVDCDPELISEALRRILDNALRYHRPESRHVWLSIHENSEQYIGFCIRDEGRGIPSQTLETLSRPFAQGDRKGRTEPGAGMSLAMIQHIAQLHGGYVEIESREGEGTAVTFWVAKSTAN